MVGFRLVTRFFSLALFASLLYPVVCSAQSEPSIQPPGDAQAGQVAPINDPAALVPINPADIKRFTVSGTVVNSATGEGVAHALVALNNQITAMTDTSGGFQFSGVAAGMYSLTPRKPGFFSSEEISPPTSPQNLVQVGPEMPPIRLRLFPEAIIFGRVTDDDGLPAQRLSVRCLRATVIEGRKQWEQVGTTVTDEDGEYRLAKITPGQYLLVAGPGQTPSLGAMAKTGRQNSGYGAAYYPAAENASNTGFPVQEGEKREIDLSVKAEPFYSVAGVLSGPVGGWVRLQSRGSDHREAPVANIERETGAFSFRMVSGGDYILQAAGQSGGQVLHGAVPLHVASNLAGVHIALEPTVTIPISIDIQNNTLIGGERAFTSPPYIPALQMRLISLDEGGQDVMSSVERTGDAERYALRNVIPGRYRMEINPNANDCYVASAQYGTADPLREDLVVPHSANQSTLFVVLRNDGAKLKGSIVEDGQPSHGTLLIVPDRGTPFVRMEQIGADSSDFSIGQLAPGSYSLLAFDDLDDLEYTNRDALEPYIGRATRVDLAANQQTTVTVELIRRGKK